MVSEWISSVSERSRSVAFHASTALLLLALFGLLLRLSGGGELLSQHSEVAGLLLVIMAPVWALFGSLLATIYLVFTIMRPYHAAQHLVEMVLGIVLTVLMRPVF